MVLDFHFSTAQKFSLCLAFILNSYRVFAAVRRAFRGVARNSAFGQGIPADALLHLLLSVLPFGLCQRVWGDPVAEQNRKTL